MLAVPTPSGTRFNRTLYDVDRTKPSPFGWRRSCKNANRRRYVRRMGLIESFFHTMATLHEGRTDIFYRIPLSCPDYAYEQLVRRMPLVWALLCRRHPLLCAWVETLTPDGTLLDPEEAVKRRHAGEADEDASNSFEPHFQFDIPDSASALIELASSRVIMLPDTWGSQVDSAVALCRSDLSVAWLEQYVWNGKRRFLQQHTPFGLARLILLPPLPSNRYDGQLNFDLVLCTAHCISDGLSISNLAGELLRILASPRLPITLPDLSLSGEKSSGVPGAAVPRYSTVTLDMKQAVVSGLFKSGQSDVKAAGNDDLDFAHFAPLLPPSIEPTYPELLPPAAPAQMEGDRAAASRLARMRWFWTIRRILCQIRAAKAEDAVLSDFKADQKDRSIKEPWWGAQTKWSVVRLSQQDTSALTQLAKRKGVRVGSLLYAVAAFALNTLENVYTPPGSRDEKPTATVMGFPFSLRRFLDSLAPVDVLQLAGIQDPLLPPSSLGVRLGFSGVALPPAELFSLPSLPPTSGGSLSLFQVAQLWQTARQVQKQFNTMFAEPRFMLADGFLMGLEREMRFRKNGVKDVFQVFKEEHESVAGDDERKPGLTKKNMQGPGSSLNFSMVGLLDPVLPCQLELPFSAKGGTRGALQVDEGLMFGVRNRAGEAFGTSFTFRGQLNLELGHDRVVWDTAKVEEYLDIMKFTIQSIVASEQRH